MLMQGVEETSKLEEVNMIIKDRNIILDKLKDNLRKAQNKMKKFADHKRREVCHEVSDQVFLKMQPYRYRSLATQPNGKLNPRFYGPFEILEKVGTTMYRLSYHP